MVAATVPALAGNGVSMRAGVFLEALTRVADVDLIVAPMFGAPGKDAVAWAQRRAARIYVLDLTNSADTHFGLVMRVDDAAARITAFARFGKPSLSARLSIKAAPQVAEMIGGKPYDIVHVSRSFCAPFALGLTRMLSSAPRPKLTLDLDEDDSRVLSGLAGLSGRQGQYDEQKWRLLEADAFRNLVGEVAPAFDRVWLSSSVEALILGARTHVNFRIFPNVIALRPMPRHHDDGRTLLFVGSLGYEPNQDAVRWLISAIWPRLTRHGNCRLLVVGASAPESLRRLGRQRGVEMLGWIQDLRQCYAAATLTVAPVRVGGGTRIKLLESAVHGVPIVTTSLGAEGLGFRENQHLWLAENAIAFSEAISYALASPKERSRRAQLARAHVTCNFGRQDKIDLLSREFLELCA
jgi:glycosyltransferase involved in cell wall biosynthesis